MKGKNKGIIYILIMLVSVGVLLAAFWKVANRNNKDSTDKVETTPITEITTRDLDKKYPKTPREVVKLYSQIILCFYNENYTEEELNDLGKKARQLFDKELLENNPEEKYYKDLKKEIEEYKKKKRTIISYDIQDSREVEYITKDNQEMAKVTAQYFMKSKKDYQRATEDYVLRKDSNKLWKIYGYTISKDSGSSKEE
ncbi:DUF6715 family protein [Anaerosacchariphilus polymeriproducens]|uniref:Uncharacterized protein n=1 Tax=Anaerosacchariphilus polymeriproducens TaxID=1812858 RepID=A0A371AVN1_9FIRM|nr:DUF6715 family protein [Anaerosacchariphilus polymeriproducens]RDU23591.1 hypothetical protein DWV06_08375 [Anaerosacchariphilus polymeriproducens]